MTKAARRESTRLRDELHVCYRSADRKLAWKIAGLCDGARSLAEIHAEIQAKRSELDYDAFKRQFDELYRVMNAINRMVLRRPS